MRAKKNARPLPNVSDTTCLSVGGKNIEPRERGRPYRCCVGEKPQSRLRYTSNSVGKGQGSSGKLCVDFNPFGQKQNPKPLTRNCPRQRWLQAPVPWAFCIAPQRTGWMWGNPEIGKKLQTFRLREIWTTDNRLKKWTAIVKSFGHNMGEQKKRKGKEEITQKENLKT